MAKAKKEKEQIIIQDEKVYTTKDMLKSLGWQDNKQNGKKLRNYLRKIERYQDGIYTRYAWTRNEFDKHLEMVKEMMAKPSKKEEKQA